MNFNETCDLNSDLLSVSGGVLRGAENTPVRRSAKSPRAQLPKIQSEQSGLPFSFHLTSQWSQPPLPSLPWTLAPHPVWAEPPETISPPQSWNHTRSCAFQVWTVVGPFSFTRCAQFKQTNIQKEEQSRMCRSCRRPLDGGVVPESCPVIYSNGDVCRGNVKSTETPFSSNARSKNIPALLKIIMIINLKNQVPGWTTTKKLMLLLLLTEIALAFLLKTYTYIRFTYIFYLCSAWGIRPIQHSALIASVPLRGALVL